MDRTAVVVRAAEPADDLPSSLGVSRLESLAAAHRGQALGRDAVTA
ncbi:hypothetical protein [Actinoplanes sp. NPDC089786]